MVTAQALVELIGPWADRRRPAQRAARRRPHARDRGGSAATGHAPAGRTRAGQGAGTQPDHDRRRLRPSAPRWARPQPTGQRDAGRARTAWPVRPHADTDAAGGDRYRGPRPYRRGASAWSSGARRRRRRIPMRSSSRSGRCPPVPAVACSRSRRRCERTCRRSSARWATTRSVCLDFGWRSPRISTASVSRPTRTRSSSRTAPSRPSTSSPSQIGGPGSAVVAREPDVHRCDRRLPHDRQSPAADARRR